MLRREGDEEKLWQFLDDYNKNSKLPILQMINDTYSLIDKEEQMLI